MEPGLRDRENPCQLAGHSREYSPQWSTALETGKTYNTGTGSLNRVPCRNGARPERPGKHGGDHDRPDQFPQAAMEPGLRDRENFLGRSRSECVRLAAMEPGLRDRENVGPRPAGDPDRVPQWSPA